MYRLYDYLPSGNGYKVRLLLTQLGIPFELVEVDIMQGRDPHAGVPRQESQRPHPALELEPGVFLAESNAILFYLAEGTPFLPDRPLERAQVLQWMCFEQYSHEPNIATSRFWIPHLGVDDERRAALEQKRVLGYAALGVMEQHLAAHAFFVGEHYSIADIALYAYTHVADEGGFDLGAPTRRSAPGSSACGDSRSTSRSRTGRKKRDR